MPRDLHIDHEFERYTVIDRLGIALPFSKGILATSILATGMETPEAYEVAKLIQEHLYANHITKIGSEELTKLSAEKMGVDVKNVYWTLGPFDGLIVFEAPDEETATALMLHLGSFGNVQTQTARAYQADEMEQILAKMSG